MSLTGKDEIAIAFHKLGSIEFFRSDAYVNLNDIAKPFGKRVDNWMRLKSTRELLDAFEKDPSYNSNPAVLNRDLRSEATGKFVKGGGLFAHPDIAIQFAQWCSPGFALWVSRQIRHLLTYGEVNIHYTEWSEEQRLTGLERNRDDIKEMYGK